jgi:integrase
MMQVKDIDSERMVVVVHQGKGRKDRITLLSEKMLDQLRIYYKTTGLRFGYLKIL